ncbi:hypothetical protein LCGC14_0507300 [marine sediment metagenome]|uniref:Uncharacterized protein n=1 Tax=marine sediment metagenome TaxID=412755 RepID=A0A0F9SKK4_9ZZZZ
MRGLWLTDDERRSITNRYYAGSDPKELADEYNIHFVSIYRVAKNAHFTHYRYCERCLSSRIHQKWCDKVK